MAQGNLANILQTTNSSSLEDLNVDEIEVILKNLGGRSLDNKDARLADIYTFQIREIESLTEKNQNNPQILLLLKSLASILKERKNSQSKEMNKLHLIRPTEYYKEKIKQLGVKESNVISTSLLKTLNDGNGFLDQEK